MSTHRPTPWRYCKQGDGIGGLLVLDANDEPIACVYTQGPLDNAALIAAAPDLLAACKGIDQAIDALRHDFGTQYPALAAAWFNVRKAVAKATGEA